MKPELLTSEQLETEIAALKVRMKEWVMSNRTDYHAYRYMKGKLTRLGRLWQVRNAR